MYTLTSLWPAGALAASGNAQARQASRDTPVAGPARPATPISPGPAGGGSSAGARRAALSTGDASGMPGAGESGDDACAAQPVAAQVLRRARRRRGWSQPRLAAEMHQVARACQRALPGVESLKTMISRWENGHRTPDSFNRELLCAALGIPVSALGLPHDIDEPAS